MNKGEQSREKNKTKKGKVETSKVICFLAVVIFSLVAIYGIMKYYQLVELAIVSESMISPDPSLAIAGLTGIIGAVISYCLYQFGLKNSRNKFGIGSDGEPFKIKMCDDSCADETTEFSCNDIVDYIKNNLENNAPVDEIEDMR